MMGPELGTSYCILPNSMKKGTCTSAPRMKNSHVFTNSLGVFLGLWWHGMCRRQSQKHQISPRMKATARAMAARAAAVSARELSMTKSWIVPWMRAWATRTPACRSLLAKASPSSRRTSAWPVMISAGGKPASWLEDARSGEAVICARWLGSVVYWSQNHCITSRRR